MLYSKVSDWNSEFFHLTFLVEFFCWWFIIRTYLIFTSVPPEYFLSCIYSDLDYPWGCVRWLCVWIFSHLCFQPYFSAWNQTQCLMNTRCNFLSCGSWLSEAMQLSVKMVQSLAIGKDLWMHSDSKLIKSQCTMKLSYSGSTRPVIHCVLHCSLCSEYTCAWTQDTAHATCNASTCMLPETPHF